MKKLMTLALGTVMAFTAVAVTFAQDTTPTKTKKKTKKKKKTDTTKAPGR
jgi:hypothetical protein